MADPFEQKITFHEFGSATLPELLELPEPVAVGGKTAFRQLGYVQSYLTNADLSLPFPCKSIAIEHHYIDRDHMEDHSVFYSKNLQPLPNFCRRVHFFGVEPGELERQLHEILHHRWRNEERPKDAYRAACSSLSSYYLGFAVIKPLPGSPLGRTVLHPYPSATTDGASRSYPCTRQYRVHLLGAELHVSGLAFQQQDVGVSACATTALWSALSKVRDFEEIGNTTPVQITMLAARYSLQFGRAMPSEGLSVDQMCQAVHSIGVAPDLLKVAEPETARAVLHAATVSGIAPVLILQSPDGDRHAVTVAGMRTRDNYSTTATKGLYDRARDLHALYVHDDRIGPYLRADLEEEGSKLMVKLRLIPAPGHSTIQPWQLTHVLIPMHSKIRLSFSGLRKLGLRTVLRDIQAVRDFHLRTGRLKDDSDRNIMFENKIVLAHTYLNDALMGTENLDMRTTERFLRRTPLSRYLGLIKVRSATLDPIDVVVDTTSTARNVHCLAVNVLGERFPETGAIARYLAKRLRCRAYTPSFETELPS